MIKRHGIKKHKRIALLMAIMISSQAFIGAAPPPTDASAANATSVSEDAASYTPDIESDRNLDSDDANAPDTSADTNTNLSANTDINDTPREPSPINAQALSDTLCTYTMADGSSYTGTFDAMWAQAVANGSGTVTLESDLTADSETGLGSDSSAFLDGGLLVKSGQDITLDLNNHTLNFNFNKSSKSIHFASIVDPDAILRIQNGNITGYTNKDGDMILNKGELYLHTVQITGNTCDTVLNTNKNSVSDLRYTNITANMCTTAGILNGGSLNIGENTTINANQAAGITFNTADLYTPNIHIDGANHSAQALEFSLPHGQLIGNNATGYSSNAQLQIFKTDANHAVYNTNLGMIYYTVSNEVTLLLSDGTSLNTSFADAWNISQDLPGSTITLNQNVTAVKNTNDAHTSFGTGPYIDGGHVLIAKKNTTTTLNLNNHTLDRNDTDNAAGDPMGMIFRIDQGANLTIKNGTVQGGNGTVAGAIYNKAGTLNLNNITLQNNKATEGGAITNKSAYTATLTGSIIQNNTCEKGGVYNTGTLNISGAMTVNDNQNETGEQININSDTGTLNITGNLTGGKVGIYTSKTENDTITTTGSASDASKLKIDNGDGLYVAFNSTNKSMIIKQVGGQAIAYDSEGSILYSGNLIDVVNWANTNAASLSLPTSIQLQTDVSMGGRTINCNASDFEIDLNGHKIIFTGTASSSNDVQVTNGHHLTITDTVQPKITSRQVDAVPEYGATKTWGDTINILYTNWHTNQKPKWNTTSKILTYYTVEYTNNKPVRMEHKVDFSACGSIQSISNATDMLHVASNGRITINGGYYAHSKNTILGFETNAAQTSDISNAWFINSRDAIYARVKFTIKDSYIINNNSTSSDNANRVTMTINASSGNVSTLTNTTIAGNSNYNNSNIVIMTGATFSNCTISCNLSTQGNGGAIRAVSDISDKIQLKNCLISGNMATAGRGGAIYVQNTSRYVTANTTKFIANKSAKGGALYQEGTSTSANTLTNCEFAYNISNVDGGAMYVKTSPINLTGCNIHKNVGVVSRGGVVLFQIKRACTIQTTNIDENIGFGTCGGMFVYQSNPIILKTSNIRNNIVASKTSKITTLTTGGIWIDGSTITIQDCEISNNDGNGGRSGGVNVVGSTANISDTSITDNKAGDGAGLYTDNNSTTNISGKIVIDRNTLMDGNTDNNAVMENGIPLHVIGQLSTESKVGVSPKEIPTAQIKLVVADGTYATGTVDLFVADDPTLHTEEENGRIVIAMAEKVEQDVDFEGVMVQYYINLRTPVIYDPDSPALKIIDMDKNNMPKNGVDVQPQFIYIDQTTGRIKMRVVLTEMYKYRTFDLNRCTSINVINRFTDLDKKGWDLAEIWVKKDGASQWSKTKADWNVYPYTEGFDIKTLNLKEKSVVRLVCNPKESEKDHNTTFFDYDITDGNLYPTDTDAKNQTNPQPVSSLSNDRTNYTNTGSKGINNPDNVAGQTGSAVFSFGNQNHGTKHQTDTIKQSGSTVNWYINRFNKPDSNNTGFEGCSFGLVKDVDSNGKLIWNDQIKAPNLFDDQPAIGKHIYKNEYSLNFYRNGSTYTLQKVNGAGNAAQDLMTLNNPTYPGKAPYTNIWTNNFWPLDEAATAGTDGHDAKEGSYEYTSTQHHKFVGDASSGYFPPSDDGVAHNCFFGMKTDINFQLTEDYTAPLHYYFFGDDDLWIFLDGKLICDIGGVHRSVGAYIDIRDYVAEGDTNKHTMSIYYTERGSSGSTCWMQFTLPATVTDKKNDIHIFKKIDGLGHEVQGSVFSVYADEACTNELHNHTSNITGNVYLTDLDPNETYYVKETYTTDEYELCPTVWELKKVDGAWVMFDKTDPNQENVTSVVNEFKDVSGPIMPDTGGNGTWLYYLVGTPIVLATGYITVRCIKKSRKKKK